MRNKWLKLWIMGLLTFTVVLFVWHQYGMNRLIHIDPRSSYPISTSDDREQGGSSVASYEKTAEELVLNCTYSKHYMWPYCHLNIHVGDDTQGIDLSKFDHISLEIRTSGSGSQAVRIFLRNYDPAYSIKGDPLTLKPSTLQYTPNQEKNPITLPLKYFQVASWWINEYLVPPEYAAPDLYNITAIQIATGGDMVQATDQIFIKSIRLYGKWISDYQLLLFILVPWVLSALFYLAASFWQFYQATQKIKLQKNELEEVNSALHLEREELKILATHDPLTGAYNRIGLRDHLYTQVSLVKNKKSSLSVIFMDLDHFKQINDDYGHDCGDSILKSFAQRIFENTRSNDFFCRWGGEEFILLCDDTVLKSAAQVAEKLRTRIEAHNWPHGIALTCSFGVAQMKPGEDISGFLKRADAALYRAKDAGRNRVIVDYQSQ